MIFKRLFFIFLSFSLFTNQNYTMKENEEKNDNKSSFDFSSTNSISNNNSIIDTQTNSEIETQTTSEQSYESHDESSKEIDALFLAVEKNDCKTIETFINNNIDLIVTNKDGYSLMHVAAYHGSLDAAQLLDNYNNILIHIQNNNNGETPLHSAMKNNQTKIVSYLLSKGVLSDTTTYAGDSPMHTGVLSGSLDALKTLYEENTQNIDLINFPTPTTNYSPLMYAVYCKEKDIVLWLLEHKANCNASIFFYAVQQGSLKIIKILCKHNPKLITITDEKFKKTPLHHAAQKNLLEVVEFFIGQGASVYDYDNNGLLPIHYAASAGCLDIVKKIYKKDKKIISMPTLQNGQTPLMLALTNNNHALVYWLIQNNADIKACDKNGNNSLYFAIVYSSVEILKLFNNKKELFFKKTILRIFAAVFFPNKDSMKMKKTIKKEK